MNIGKGFSEVQVGSSDLSQSVNLLVTGNLGIGTTDTKGYKLAIAGNTVTEKLVVKNK